MGAVEWIAFNMIRKSAHVQCFGTQSSREERVARSCLFVEVKSPRAMWQLTKTEQVIDIIGIPTAPGTLAIFELWILGRS